jgi:outer membrane protein
MRFVRPGFEFPKTEERAIMQGWSSRSVAAVVVAIAAMLLLPSARPALAAEQVKIGYLDLDRVIQAVAKQTSEYEELNRELEKRQADIERRRAEIEKLEDDLKANRVIWSEDKSRDQENLVRDKLSDLKKYSKDAQEYRDEGEAKILRRLLPDIGKVVRTVGERDGYSMIFEKRILLYFSPAFDLTDTIIKEMSAQASE